MVFSSAYLFNIATAGYFLAFFILSTNLIYNKRNLHKISVIVVATSFIVQTMGLLVRWGEAGFVEVQAFERSMNMKLTGSAWFIVFTQHPPWSNLYEIMVYMSWGLILVYMLCEVKWRIRFMGILALLLALCALGVASLNSGLIKPLVPALKSWWIMVHVISASIAYAAGTIAAILSLFYLIQSPGEIALKKVLQGAIFVVLCIVLLLNGGFNFIWEMVYPVKLLKSLGSGHIEVVHNLALPNQPAVMVSAPGLGFIYSMLFILSLLALAVLQFSKNIKLHKVLCACVLLLSLVVYVQYFINAIFFFDAILPNTQIQASYEGPYLIGYQSDPWGLAFYSVGFIGLVFVASAYFFPNQVRARLISAKKLDQKAYAAILFSFALMALVLVTGALWANYAWGRYWAWDPKEVGALLIWLTYALYLHTRITYGWKGVGSAVVAIVGFFIIIAGFLGVNLGWFAEGLHSYGSA